MEKAPVESKTPSKIGDRQTSDVVVRLRTHDGRDDWLYCHSDILVQQSKYFADRLSDSWPTCQILDSRNCVEVYCEEPDLDCHVNVLRLFYVIADGLMNEICHGVRNALGILRVAVKLGCPRIIAVCVDYLEAVPWEEAEEEEILNTIPVMGNKVEPILARLQPVNPTAVMKIFRAALQFATSSPPTPLNDLKSTAQEQLEYMLTEDDDAPLLRADEEIKLEVILCVNKLFDRFNNLVESRLCDLQKSISDAGKMQSLHSCLTDLSWACQILGKLEIMRDFVCSWTELSVKLVKVVQQKDAENQFLKTKLKVLEVTAKVLEAVGYGIVVLPTVKRLHMVKLWLPFVQTMKPLVDSATEETDDDDLTLKVDSEIWQSLESAFVSMILTLPSVDQAEILTEWLQNQQIRYPDLTEAFEAWCYRSKVAKRRLSALGEEHNTTKAIQMFQTEAEMSVPTNDQDFYELLCSECGHMYRTSIKKEIKFLDCGRKAFLTPRARIEVEVADGSGSASATLSGEPAEKFLQMTASEIYEIVCTQKQQLPLERIRRHLAHSLFQIHLKKSFSRTSELRLSVMSFIQKRGMSELAPPAASMEIGSSSNTSAEYTTSRGELKEDANAMNGLASKSNRLNQRRLTKKSE